MSYPRLRFTTTGFLLLAALAGSARAGILLESGSPQPPPELSTYGMQVDLERAIRSVLPQTWHVVLEPDRALQGKVSWGADDTWLSVLRRISTGVDAGFLVDWDARTVIVRSVPSTLEDASEREKVRQAATTPLPALRAQLPHVPPASVPAPVVAVPSAPEPIPAKPVPTVATPIKLARSVPRTANAPRAFNRVSIRVPLEVLAARHDLTLRYEADEFSLPGPLTLMLGEDLAEDVQLLKRALGPELALAITHYRSEKELLVQRADVASFESYDARPRPPTKKPFLTRLFERAGGRGLSEQVVSPARISESLPSSLASKPELPNVPSSAAPGSAPDDADRPPTTGASALVMPVLAPPAPVTANNAIVIPSQSRAFGDLMTQAARSFGFTAVLADTVDQRRVVSSGLPVADGIEGVRQLAFASGYVAILDRDTKTVRVAERANLTYRLPPSVFQNVQARSSGSDHDSAVSLAGEFRVDSERRLDAKSLEVLLRQLAGAGANVFVSELGIVNIEAGAEAHRRIREFLKSFLRTAMSQVEIEGVVLQVSLAGPFALGIAWDRVLSGEQVDGALASGSAFTRETVSDLIGSLRRMTSVRVVSSPRIITMNQTPATFFNGPDLEGIGLSVQPIIIDEHHLELTLNPTFTSASARAPRSVGEGERPHARISGRSFMHMMAPSGQTLILSGLREGASTDTHSAPTELVILLRVNVRAPSDIDALLGELP